MNNKIIFAIVKIPIEILEDGEINTLTDRITVNFEPCDELPDATNVDYDSITEKLMKYINVDADADADDCIEQIRVAIEETTKTILKDEIKKGARPINSSFKRRAYKHKHTAKNLS
jgi:hypothetical protein